MHPALDPAQFSACAPTEPAGVASHDHWQPKTIELVEVAPPPLRVRSPHSVVTSSSGYSSSTWASSSSSSASASAPSEHAVDARSYCSSDPAGEEDDGCADEEEWCSDAGTTRRVLAWRASFSAASSARAPLDPWERKAPATAPIGPPPPDRRAPRALSLPHASCSACDASFASLTHYRRHGSDAGTPEPCRAAVSYALEQTS